MSGPRRQKPQRISYNLHNTPTDEPVYSTYSILSHWKLFTGLLILAIALYMGLLGYLETRVNTPFFDEKVIQETGQDIPERYWGTYRPGHYFGIKARDPRSPIFGLMWYDPVRKTTVRHWCDERDQLSTYGFDMHDGASFGTQKIVDGSLHMHTSFMNQPAGKRGGHWTARINITSQSSVSIFWYVALDESLGNTGAFIGQGKGSKVVGYTPELGDFEMTLTTLNVAAVHHEMTAEAYVERVDRLKENLLHRMLQPARHDTLGTVYALSQDYDVPDRKMKTNFIVIQLIVDAPASFDVIFKSLDSSEAPLHGLAYSKELEKRQQSFVEKFDDMFNVKKLSDSTREVSMTALSNMLGGIGYFYGAGRVQSQYTKEPVPYWKSALYTAVPSRSFFPRGFLWDEGFHGQLISKWSPEIFLDIAGHWLDLMNIEGWIPREQILGLEALARVPKEFVVQNNAAANPPMLLLTIARLVKKRPELFKPHGGYRGMLDRMFPRLQAWLQWFLSTQRGMEPTSFMWHGRDDSKPQLNPNTLTSGLDDYPRASHVSGLERHVDLRCWMFASAEAMNIIAIALDRDNSRYEALRDQLGDEKLLNQLHWAEEEQMYADYGLHTDDVKLARVPKKNAPPGETEITRLVGKPPQPKFVTSAYGYVSLFPLLLKVLSPKSEKLGILLEKLDDPEHMWSPYGLRSLSKKSPYYMKFNTESDKPYWRGQIWINVNYLALAALKHYGAIDGPYAARARQLHDALKKNVVRLIVQEHKRTGYLWEQYSDSTGHGSGCRPFAGWTALLPLILAEDY